MRRFRAERSDDYLPREHAARRLTRWFKDEYDGI